VFHYSKDLSSLANLEGIQRVRATHGSFPLESFSFWRFFSQIHQWLWAKRRSDPENNRQNIKIWISKTSLSSVLQSYFNKMHGLRWVWWNENSLFPLHNILCGGFGINHLPHERDWNCYLHLLIYVSGGAVIDGSGLCIEFEVVVGSNDVVMVLGLRDHMLSP